MNGDSSSVFAMVYEDEFRSLKGSLATKGAKLAAQAKMRRLDRILAGWKSLSAWEGLDDDCAVSDAGIALADAGLNMIEDQKYQRLALIELCRALIKMDKPKAWARCVDKMKALPVLGNGLDVFAPRRLEIWEAEPMSWIGMAARAKAWKCVAVMADLPMAKVGLLGFDEDGRPDAGFKGRSARGMGCFIEQWDGDDSDERMAEQLKIWRVATRASQDPLIMIWAQEVSDSDAAPPPAKLLRMMSRNGMGASWGEPGFEGAAAALALSGSSGALAGCIAHGVKPELGMLAASYRAREGFSPMASCSAGRYPALAEGISQPSWHEEQNSWRSIAEWLNQAGGGVAEDYEIVAALSLLENALERGWPTDAGSTKARSIQNVLNWLLVANRQADVPAERIELLNNAAVDAAEAEARSGKASPMRATLMEVLKKWAGPMIPTPPAAAIRL